MARPPARTVAAKPSGPWQAVNKLFDTLLARTAKLEASAGKVGDVMTVALTPEDLDRLQARRLTIGGQTLTVVTLKE